MKKIIILVLVGLSFVLNANDKKIEGAGGLMWYTMLEDAIKDAQERDTAILVNFTGSDWCHWCFKLDEDVFSRKEFKDWQKDNVTLLMIDFPQKKMLSDEQTKQNRFLANVYGIQGFPTIVVLNKQGEYLNRIGYGSDVNKWIKSIEGFIINSTN